MPYAEIKKKRIHYTSTGKGKHVVFIHGYPESLVIWKKFVKELSKDYTVTAIDLPGFGKSDNVAETHTFEIMAEAVHAVLKELKIRKCILVGHSMGGFTSLYFAEKYPEMLAGLVMFHSHPFEDLPETKIAREKFISLIRTDKQKFLKEYISLLFWNKTIGKYKKQFAELIDNAIKLPQETLIAAMKGMMVRKDKTKVLKDLKVPVLFIIGQQDSRFPVARTWDIIRLPKHSEVLLLKDVAHMGFLEAEAETIKGVGSFVKRIYA